MARAKKITYDDGTVAIQVEGQEPMPVPKGMDPVAFAKRLTAPQDFAREGMASKQAEWEPWMNAPPQGELPTTMNIGPFQRVPTAPIAALAKGVEAVERIPGARLAMKALDIPWKFGELAADMASRVVPKGEYPMSEFVESGEAPRTIQTNPRETVKAVLPWLFAGPAYRMAGEAARLPLQAGAALGGRLRMPTRGNWGLLNRPVTGEAPAMTEEGISQMADSLGSIVEPPATAGVTPKVPRQPAAPEAAPESSFLLGGMTGTPEGAAFADLEMPAYMRRMPGWQPQITDRFQPPRFRYGPGRGMETWRGRSRQFGEPYITPPERAQWRGEFHPRIRYGGGFGPEPTPPPWGGGQLAPHYGRPAKRKANLTPEDFLEMWMRR